MDFLNAVLLGGVAFASLPVLIHLLNRARVRTVDWGAMYWLDSVIESHQRRAVWEEWWLLLVRCAIPVMLAVSLARPVLTHYRLPLAQPESLTLLVDNSLSMGRLVGDESLLDIALRELTSLARQAGQVTCQLWTTSAPVTSISATTLSPPQLEQVSRRVPSPAGSGQNLAALERALESNVNSGSASYCLILASDFQAAEWRELEDAQLQDLANRLARTTPPTRLHLLPVRANAPATNLGIELIQAEAVARLAQPTGIVARVTNHGKSSVEQVQVTWQVDGVDLSSRQFPLAAGASQQVEFAYEFVEQGWRNLSVRVDDPGDLHGDDVCYHVVQVVEPQRVLLIDDGLREAAEELSTGAVQASPSEFSGASCFVQLALAPFATPEQNPFRVHRCRSSEVPQLELDDFAVVLIADLDCDDRDGSDMQCAASLARYVQAGGGLLVFADADMSQDEALVVPALATSAAETSSPLPLWSYRAVSNTSGLPKRVSAVANDAELMGADWPANSWQTIEFDQWWEMVPPPTSQREGPPSHRVVLQYQSGSPWIVEMPFGQGWIVQCGSTCTDVGSNLPSQPVFVPLMISLVERLVRHRFPKTEFMVGQAVELHVQKARQPATNARETAESLTAGVRRISSEPDTMSRLEVVHGRTWFTDTRLPGNYATEWLAATEPGVSVSPAMLSLNLKATESQPSWLSDSELDALASRLGATVIKSAADYQQLTRLHRDGWELWRWGVGLVLVLLFVELMLAGNSGRVH